MLSFLAYVEPMIISIDRSVPDTLCRTSTYQETR